MTRSLAALVVLYGCSGAAGPATDAERDAQEAYADNLGDVPAGDAEARDAPWLEAVDAARDRVEDAARTDLEVEARQDVAQETDGQPSCDCPAPSIAVTVNGIPADMNGSVPYLNNNGEAVLFRLAVPAFGFAWDVVVDCPCGCADAGIKAWTDVAAGPFAPGEDLSAKFVEEAPGTWRFMVSGKEALPAADAVTLHAAVLDECAQESETALVVQAVEMLPMLHPFDLEDPWLMSFSRDNYAIGWQLDTEGKVEIVATDGSDGMSDFLEDLWVVGLGTPDPLPGFAAMQCAGFTGGNECLARELLARMRVRAYTTVGCGPEGEKLPGCVSLRFYIEGEPGAPTAADFAYQQLDGTESERLFSVMGFGGGDLSKSWIGYSETCDLWNVQNENNNQKQYGLFTTSLVRFLFQKLGEDEALQALAQTLLADIVPAMGGVALGELPGDELAVDFSVPASDLPDAVQSRREKLEMVLEAVSAGLAALMLHELGHSVGLVPDGAPPYGLFAGEKNASFIANPAGSVGPHIDTAGPNLMAAGPGSGNDKALDISFLMQPFFFEPLSLAYLQGRLVVLPPP